MDFLENRKLEDWKHTVDVNLTSVFIGCKTVVPHMKSARYGIPGRDLRVYSRTGLSAAAAGYLSSKAGAINLTRALAAAYAPYVYMQTAFHRAAFFETSPGSL